MSSIKKTKKIKVKGVECPECKEKIWSRYRHDFRYCECKYTFVDGGREYLRYGFEDFGDRPKEIELEVDPND